MNTLITTVLAHSWHPFRFVGDLCGSTGADCHTDLPHVNAGSNELQGILSIAFGVLAALSVLFIVIAGLRFITAQGNPQETSKAKSTIIYALVGLVVALTAEAFVAFVLTKLNKP